MDVKNAINRNHNSIRTEVVTTYEQLLHAHAVRAICFMEEHGVTARQTYDGNDYQATHFVVYAGTEPIGTVRIRWFKDFAKFERASFRKEYREMHVIKSCANAVFEHVARKGYDKVITHAKPRYAALWRKLLGFKIVDGKRPLEFAGHDEAYQELVKFLQPPENAISEATGMDVLFRIEGHWDVPSEFEMAEA
ncbi:MAG TPA: GNAT family N-acetyltransferase [Burkholderiales bacterium]|nr:GNAT family N-acetyltransferase [Burkholderiales bacterium]